MSSELSELDELIESDVLEALGEKVAEDSSIEIDGITIEDIEPQTQEDILSEEPNENESVQDTTDDNTLNENTIDASDETILESPESPQEVNLEPLHEKSNVKEINTTDLASLLSELLNNKTIEITIKVKN